MVKLSLKTIFFCSHLGHAVRQVGWNGGETFPSTVHDVVTAGAHGRTRAAACAAWLQAGRLLVTWRRKEEKNVFTEGKI